jgi:hypothetical protein
VSFSQSALSKRAPYWAHIIAAAQIPQLATGDQAAPLADARPPSAVAAEPDTPLTMEEAARLSLIDQPLLTGREAKIQAEEQQAVAAAQLPDPKLSGGLKELPIDTPEAFSVRRDNFTEFTIGPSQEFPRAAKRRLQSVRKQLDADADRAASDCRTLPRTARIVGSPRRFNNRTPAKTASVTCCASCTRKSVRTMWIGAISRSAWPISMGRLFPMHRGALRRREAGTRAVAAASTRSCWRAAVCLMCSCNASHSPSNRRARRCVSTIGAHRKRRPENRHETQLQDCPARKQRSTSIPDLPGRTARPKMSSSMR